MEGKRFRGEKVSKKETKYVKERENTKREFWKQKGKEMDVERKER